MSKVIVLVSSVFVACGGNTMGTPDAAPHDASQLLEDPGPRPAVLTISPLTADYGTVVDGTHGDLTFTVTNTGQDVSGNITAQIAGGDAASFAVTVNGCSTLAPGATCTIVAEFSPTLGAVEQTSLVVSSSPGGSAEASLAGTGVGAEGLEIVSATNTSFGTTTIGSTNVTSAVITVINVGSFATGAIATQLTGADPGEFAIVTDTCMGTMLQPSATCQVTATFAPSIPGSKAASVALSANPGGSVSVSLSGTALGPLALQILPSPVDFGIVSLTLQSATQRFVVTNVNGSASGALTEAITGSDADQWTLVASTCVGVSLDPGASCTVDVAFSPITLGSHAASLTVAGATEGNATLLGQGLSLEGIVMTAASPFADTAVGQTSAVQTLTITNPAGVTTGVLSTALAGADPTQFTIVSDQCHGAALMPNGQCTITLAFAPTSATPSLDRATLTATAIPGGTVTTGLSGNVVAPVLAIAPPSFDFGDVAAGTSAQTTLTVTNSGAASSGTLVATASGASDFSTLADHCSGVALATGDSCTIDVQLAPITTGPRSATFTISSSSATAAVSVTGNGVADGAFLAITGSEQFADTVVGHSSATRTITVSNIGALATGGLVDTLDPAQFTVIADSCAGFTLDAGTDCIVIVAFTPTTAGAHAATFELAGSPGGVAATGVSGTALAPPARRP